MKSRKQKINPYFKTPFRVEQFARNLTNLKPMENYYFTFGSDHRLKSGYPMNNNWVRVQAKDYGAARNLFIDKFSSVHMERPMGWSFQYLEKDFDASFFPKGEYLSITQNKKPR